MLEICIQTSYDQNAQLILKSYLPVVLGTTLRRESTYKDSHVFDNTCLQSYIIKLSICQI